MTVIPFPPATDRPKPGNEASDLTGLYAEIDRVCCELNLPRTSQAAEHLRFLVAEAHSPAVAPKI